MEYSSEINDALTNLEKGVGKIQGIEQLSQGVYYLTILHQADPFCTEYYAVCIDSPIISPEAKSYGKAAPGYSELLLYSMEDTCSGFLVVRYELYRHYSYNHIPLPDGETLRSIALVGAEYHPEYFGNYPVPAITPHGFTVRHRTFANGIYWLETDQADQILAIAYPLWDDLSDCAQKLAESPPHEDAPGYMFFGERASSIPVFELLSFYPSWIETGLIDKPALMNAIWQSFPAYAVIANSREQSGSNDMVGMLLNELGENVEPNISSEHLLRITPDAGINFLRFPVRTQGGLP